MLSVNVAGFLIYCARQCCRGWEELHRVSTSFLLQAPEDKPRAVIEVGSWLFTDRAINAKIYVATAVTSVTSLQKFHCNRKSIVTLLKEMPIQLAGSTGNYKIFQGLPYLVLLVQYMLLKLNLSLIVV